MKSIDPRILAAAIAINVSAQDFKIPLYEIFTSSTCAYCPYKNAALDSILSQEPGKYSLIKYPVNWPGNGDPYYTTDVSDRVSFYGIKSAPALGINGIGDTTGYNVFTQEMFDSSQNKPTGLRITASAAISLGKTIKISATINPDINYSSGNRLYLAMVEDSTTGNVGDNGETVFYNTFLKFVPDTAGIDLGAMSTGKPISISQSVDMSTTHAESMNNLRLVAFVQNLSSQIVLQSAMVDVALKDTLNTSVLAPGNLPFVIQGDQIHFASELEQARLQDLQGRLVQSVEHGQNMDLSPFAPGLYFLQIGNPMTKPKLYPVIKP